MCKHTVSCIFIDICVIRNGVSGAINDRSVLAPVATMAAPRRQLGQDDYWSCTEGTPTGCHQSIPLFPDLDTFTFSTNFHTDSVMELHTFISKTIRLCRCAFRFSCISVSEMYFQCVLVQTKTNSPFLFSNCALKHTWIKCNKSFSSKRFLLLRTLVKDARYGSQLEKLFACKEKIRVKQQKK